MSQTKEKDMELWHAFKQNPGPETFNPLYNHMKPLVQSAISKFKTGSSLPASAFDMFAADQFLKTVQSYDPSKGKLSTKLHSDLQSVGRVNYAYQNIGRIPEPRIIKTGPLQSAMDYLRSTLGRDPSDGELADEVGMPLKQVVTLKRELRSDLMVDSGSHLEQYFSDFENPTDQRKAQEVYFDLNGTEQVAWDYATGMHGKPRLQTTTGRTDWDAIAKKLRVSTSDIRRIRNRIRRLWNRE